MNTPHSTVVRLLSTFALLAISQKTTAQQILTANNDFGHTQVNQTIELDVLRNDIANGAILRLDKIAVSNQGTAQIRNNRLVFTPKSDFKGVATINYTVCDNANNCDCALVRVDVAAAEQPARQEWTFFTGKGMPIDFTVPEGFVPLRPNFGTISPVSPYTSGVFVYQPNWNFVGNDAVLLTKTENGVQKIIDLRIKILDTPTPPQYVADDNAFLGINDATIVNVLRNDDTSRISRITFGQPTDANIARVLGANPNPASGIIQLIGLAKGTTVLPYTATLRTGGTETGKINIVVANYEPRGGENITLTALRDVPLVVNSFLPENIDFNFTLPSENTQNGGRITYSEAYRTYTSASGDVIMGSRLLIYEPPTNSTEATDRFLVTYNSGNIEKTMLVNIDLTTPSVPNRCTGDCVYPGDANQDGRVDVKDLYIIGKSIGLYGTPRTDRNTAFYPRPAQDWAWYENGINLKHADTDGDGVITANDTVLIAQHYGKYTRLVPSMPTVNADLQLTLRPNATSFNTGDLIEIALSVGAENSPAFDLKGIDFTASYNAGRVQNLHVDYSNDNFLTHNNAFLEMSRTVGKGSFEAGVVRTRDKKTQGFGTIGVLRGIVIEDNIWGFNDPDPSVQIQIKDIVVTDNNGNRYNIAPQTLTVPITKTTDNEPITDADLKMYPNPAYETVNFYLKGDNMIQSLAIRDLMGRVLFVQKNVAAKDIAVDITDFSKGIYIVEIQSEKGNFVRKLDVAR